MNKGVKLSVATLACALAMTTVQIVNAQTNAPVTSTPVQTQPVTVKRHGAHRLAKLAQELGLNASQKSQIKTIMKTSAQERKSIRTAQISQEEKKVQLKTLRQTTHKEIAQVLTPGQRAKWNQLHKGHQAKNA
jgi:Spy/CpxP family protein refolding chaperone